MRSPKEPDAFCEVHRDKVAVVARSTFGFRAAPFRRFFGGGFTTIRSSVFRARLNQACPRRRTLSVGEMTLSRFLPRAGIPPRSRVRGEQRTNLPAIYGLTLS